MKKIILAIMLMSATAQVSGLEYTAASNLETPREFQDRMDKAWAGRQRANKERRAYENRVRERRMRNLERNYDLLNPNNKWNPYQDFGRRSCD